MLGIISPTSGLNAILGAALVELGWCQHGSLHFGELAAAYRMGCRRRCQPKRPTREQPSRPLRRTAGMLRFCSLERVLRCSLSAQRTRLHWVPLRHRDAGPPANLSHDPLKRVVGAYLLPVGSTAAR